jgi:hypothetical protein
VAVPTIFGAIASIFLVSPSQIAEHVARSGEFGAAVGLPGF